MDRPRSYHTKWSKPDEKISLIYDILKKSDTDELIYKT